MSAHLRRQIGQLVVSGFSGTEVPVELRALAREFELGGIILFARNIEAPTQVAELAYDLRRLKGELPPWVSVDQEGGRVQRLGAPCTVWPPVSTLGRSGDARLAERFARALARELRAVGITLDYAPVLDVDTNPRNPVIGDRAISGDSQDVAALGSLIVRTLQCEGIAACGKHFPGHGDTSVDSHEDLPVVELDADRLREVEFEPFRSAITADVAALMVAHVTYPSLDEAAPATLSAPVVAGVLRQELGFSGLIVTDDMEMGAIAKHYDVVDASVKAVTAGCDMLLLCGTDQVRQMEVIEGLIYALEEGTLSERRVEDALKRQRHVKARFLSNDPDWRPPTARELQLLLGRAEHQEVAAAMRRQL